MNFNVLTTVLTTIVDALGKAQSGMGKARTIMTGLAVIEIVLAALWIAMDGGSLSDGFKNGLAAASSAKRTALADEAIFASCRSCFSW